MDIQVEYQQLSKTERAEIDHYIDERLVEHLYKTTPSGIITALIVSTMIAIFLYKNSSFSGLLSWFIGFNSTQLFILALYISYKNFKNKLNTKSWGTAISVLISILSVFYGACVLFMPQEIIRQFLLLAILLMTASSFSMASVGLFKLCIASVCSILVPVTIWAFSYDSFYYKISGVLLILYNFFLLAMNYRSTEWLRNSLKLTRILATHDALTGLANRSLLYQAFEASLAKANEPPKKVAILFLDLDGFKKINDTLGHEVGDNVLLDFSKKIKSCLSDNDLAARLGGDEFIVMLEDSQLNSTISVAENILKTLTKPIKVETHEIHIGASIGISLYPKDGNSIQELIKKADLALYQAKKTGKAKYQFHTDYPV